MTTDTNPVQSSEQAPSYRDSFYALQSLTADLSKQKYKVDSLWRKLRDPHVSEADFGYLTAEHDAAKGELDALRKQAGIVRENALLTYEALLADYRGYDPEIAKAQSDLNEVTEIMRGLTEQLSELEGKQAHIFRQVIGLQMALSSSTEGDALAYTSIENKRKAIAARYGRS